MGKDRELMATGSVGMWRNADSSVGLEERDAASASTAGMDGKAWEVGEGKRAPGTAVSLQGNGDRDLATGKLTFFLILCVCVCLCVFWFAFVCFPIGQEIGQAVRGEHKVLVLPQCKWLAEYELAESYPMCIR